MFQKNNKKLWAVLIVLIALVAIMIVMQTQVLVILQDLQTSLFSSWGWNFDANPLPPSIVDPTSTIELSPTLVK